MSLISPIKHISSNCKLPMPEKLAGWLPPVNPDKNISIHLRNIDLKVKEILSRHAQMDLNDYKQLSEPEKKILRFKAIQLPKQDFKGFFVKKANVDDVVLSSKIIISNLDEKYGKNKYVFCSIGRSPALFANVLEAMGVESKICRYSARAYYDEFCFWREDEKNQQIYNEYRDYLKHIGLSTEVIKNSPKTYVFTDYVQSTGRNLRSFQGVIEDPTVGLKLDNVKFEKMNDLGYDGKDKSSNINYFNYLKYMEHGTFKSYSITPEDESIPFIQRPYLYVGHKVGVDEIKVFRFALFDKLLSTE